MEFLKQLEILASIVGSESARFGPNSSASHVRLQICHTDSPRHHFTTNDASEMTGKRPHEPDGASGDAKRIRSNNGSPAPPPRPAPNGESEMERKKREAAERMAAVKARLAASKPNGASAIPATSSPAPVANGTVDMEAKKAEAQRRIAEMKERMAVQRGQGGGGRTASPVNGAGAPPQQSQQQSEREARIAEARARAAGLSRQRNTGPAPSAPTPVPAPRQDGRTAKGGLGIGLHPSLMGDAGGSSASAGKGKAAQGPKFSTTKGNQQPQAPRTNPYLPADDDAENNNRPEHEHDATTYDATLSTRRGGERKSKQLIFNQKGKFMAQANALRQQARLEEMKRRIAAETRKVEIEEASDKAFLVPAPPDVEWWDEGMLPENQGGYTSCLDEDRNTISTSNSIITALIQHPVMLQAPQDKLIPAPKPLMLTQTEQKKLRRQRRMADMKEEQAKIRLGLIEPPAPKVKKSNMMRVLGEQAVKDPTAVEARVNREIAARATAHLSANEERKLTKAQREAKLKAQQDGDEAKGVKVAVFRVGSLSSGKHRYQVDVHAKQSALTGMVVLHPLMNLVIVEGGPHSVGAYKKLMLNRIKWDENAAPLSNDDGGAAKGGGTFTGGHAAEGSAWSNKAAEWCNPLDANGELKDLSANRCVLVWEGDEQARVFKKWGSKACETDGEARDVLGRQKMENMWTLARSL